MIYQTITLRMVIAESYVPPRDFSNLSPLALLGRLVYRRQRHLTAQDGTTISPEVLGKLKCEIGLGKTETRSRIYVERQIFGNDQKRNNP